MSKIDQLRSEIDEIHRLILPLFLKRLDLAQAIWIEKSKAKIENYDLKREDHLIHQFDDSLSTEEQKKAVQALQKQLLLLTKDYLSACQKEFTHEESK